MMLPDPEEMASAFREKARQQVPPIDLKAIARRFSNLLVKEVKLDGEGMFIDLGERGAEIYLRKDANFTRKRFTLAHELGHFALRGHVPEPAAQRKKTKGRNTEVEHWCNSFAASLLMPSNLVLDLLRSRGMHGLIDCLIEGPKKFAVSAQAFRTRVCEVAPISIFEFDVVDEPPELQHYFLSQARSDVIWSSEMDPIFRRMLRDKKKPTATVEYWKNFIIVGGAIGNRIKEDQYLVVLLPKRST